MSRSLSPRCAWARPIALWLGLLLACAPMQADEIRPVRLIVPAPPGGNLDNMARLLAHRLTALTGEPHLVENRPGANTQIGTEYVVHAPADGRVLLYAGTSIAFLPLLQKVDFSPLDDLTPVAQVSTERYLLVVAAASPANTARELEQLAAGRPAGLNCVASPGATRIACDQLSARLGGKSTTVPYAGLAQALNALMGEHADLMFVNYESSHRLVETGKLRVLATSDRIGLTGGAAQAPLMSELWPGFVLEGSSGIFVPARTPQARVIQLNRVLNQILADPQVRALMRSSGQEPVGGSSLQYRQSLRQSHLRYAQVIQRLDLGYR